MTSALQCGARVGVLLLAVAGSRSFAGPVEFGKSELNAAIAARGIPSTKLRVTAEVATDPPESFRIEGSRIFGGDLRGLMYGLLEAADQIRTTGKLSNTRGHPAVPLRGIRIVIRSASQLDGDDYWIAFVSMLARNRFNRLNVVFAHEAAQLDVPKLRRISQLAADHGLEFTLGLVEPEPVLQALLRDCPSIRNVQIRNAAVTPDLLHALRESGRLVRLEVEAGVARQGAIQASRQAGVPLRLWSGERGFADLLEREPSSAAPDMPTPLPMINGLPKAPVLSRPYEFYWTPTPHRLFLWGDPDHVRRAVPGFTMSDTQGFEVEAPIARSAVFSPANKHRVFWSHDFERYWLFYTLWGRLSYDPSTPERVWMQEMDRRFGASALDVMRAYRLASSVLEQISARGGDHVAGVNEAVRNRIEGIASAKQTPLQIAGRLHSLALELQQILEQIRKTSVATTPEWLSTDADFNVLANLALYRGRKHTGADALASYEVAGSDPGMYAARRELTAALGAWKNVTALTDELYAVSPWQDDEAGEQARTSAPASPYINTGAVQHWPEYLPRPVFEHVPPAAFEIGKPLSLTLHISQPDLVRSVRLHYRSLNERDTIRSINTDARTTVTLTIPPADLPGRYDVMYYFELLNDRYGGWLHPDPVTAAPYFVVRATKR